MIFRNILLIFFITAMLSACGSETVIPVESTPVEEQADIYPDYRNITIPPNICPLNIQIKSSGRVSPS